MTRAAAHAAVRLVAVAALAAACGATACGTTAPRLARRPVRPPTTERQPDPADTVGVRLARVVAAAGAQGGRLSHEPSRMLLVEGEHKPIELTLTGGRCHVLVGLATPSVADLDMALHELGGMQLAQDAERNAFPSIRFCPPRSTDVFLVVTSYQGAGEVLVADLDVPAGARIDLAAALGETTPPEIVVPAVPPGAALPSAQDDEPGTQTTASAEQALANASQEMLDIGYVAFGDPGGGALAEGTVAPHPISLAAGACYVLLAAGGSGVRDLDLRLVDPGGGEVARDTATDPLPRIRVCPEVSGPFRMEVRMFSGTGRYAYRALLLSSLEGVPTSLPSAVRQRFAELSGRLQRRGFSRVGPALRGALFFGNRQMHSIEVQRDRCYALAAAGGTEGDLDLYVWGPDGSARGSDTGDDSTPVVMFCASEPTTVDAEIRLFRARSEYVLGVFVSPGDSG